MHVRLEVNLVVVREAARRPFGAGIAGAREAANEAPVVYGGANQPPSHLGVDGVNVDEAALAPIRRGGIVLVKRECGEPNVVAVAALGNARHGRRASGALRARAFVSTPGETNNRAGLHAAGNRCDVGGVTRACRRRRKA